MSRRSAQPVTSKDVLFTRTEEDYYDDYAIPHSIAVIEEDSPEPVNIGILDSYGKPIYRIPVEKPPIGFVTPPEYADLYETNTETDFYYSTDE